MGRALLTQWAPWVPRAGRQFLGAELQWSPGRCGRNRGPSQLRGPLSCQHSLMVLPWGPLGSSTEGWEGVCLLLWGWERPVIPSTRGEQGLQPPAIGSWSTSAERGLAESARAGGLPQAMEPHVLPRGTVAVHQNTGESCPMPSVVRGVSMRRRHKPSSGAAFLLFRWGPATWYL